VRPGWLLLAPRRLAAGISSAAAIVAIGCTQVLSAGDYYVVPDRVDTGPSGVPDGGLLDATTTPDGSSDRATGNPDGPIGDAGSPAGDGCAPGTSRSMLENACTGAMCVPFDNGRVTLCSDDGGKLTCPPVPPSDAGLPPPLPSDAGVDAGNMPPCSSLPMLNGFTFPQPYIYGSGSTALSLYVGKIAQAFANQGQGTILYQIAGSCYGAYTTVLANTYPLSAVAATTGPATAAYFDPLQSDANGVPLQYACRIDQPARTADFGVSDVFPTTCLPQLRQNGGLPNNLHDFFGPVQTMVLAVPTGSTQTSISADAAYMVWGFGNGSGVLPWTNEGYLLQRSGSSGTQSMVAAAISVDPFAWHGVMHKANQDVLADMLAAAANPDPSVQGATMGVLGADFVEDNRAQITVLAYQDRGQTCGYYPDSTPTAHDKQNVRDGHYPIWGPSHFIAAVNGSGQPSNATVKQFIDALSGTTAVPGLNLLQAYQQRHVIPQCAMRVTRSSDGEDYQPYAAPDSCSCYYDFLTGGRTDCVPCKNSGDCTNAPNGATNCNVFGSPGVGYCESPGN
jgi:hypothetical protein